MQRNAVLIVLISAASAAGCGLPPPDLIRTDGDGGIVGSGTEADPIRLSDDEKKKLDDLGRMPWGSYIQNLALRAPPQSAGFNIAGSGAFGGDVGIGTATPNLNMGPFQRALTISAGSSGDSSAILELQGARTMMPGTPFAAIAAIHKTSTTASIEFDRNGADDAGSIRFATKPDKMTSNSSRMIITSTGNVGIGTLIPEFPLGDGGSAISLMVNTAHGGTGSEGLLKLTSTSTGMDSMGAISFGSTGISGPNRRTAAIASVKRDDNTDAATGDLEFFTANHGPLSNVAMIIRENGKVGIGTPSPSTLLHVNGDAANTTGVWAMLSDIRLKKNVAPLYSALERLLSLRGVTFEWKDAQQHGDRQGVYIGFIAQEVERVFPGWVSTDGEGNKRVATRGFEALTVESLRELKAENERLVAKNSELERRLSVLERLGDSRSDAGPRDRPLLTAFFLGAVCLALLPWWSRRSK